MTDPLDLAGRTFAARVLVRRHRAPPGTMAAAEIARFLTDPGFAPSADQMRTLFADPLARETWRRMKASLARSALPALAAASDREMAERPFPGGRVRLRRSRAAGQVYVLCRFDPGHAPDAPFLLVLEAPGGTPHRLAFAAPDAGGEAVGLLDEARAEDGAILALLADPRTEGVFAW